MARNLFAKQHTFHSLYPFKGWDSIFLHLRFCKRPQHKKLSFIKQYQTETCTAADWSCWKRGTLKTAKPSLHSQKKLLLSKDKKKKKLDSKHFLPPLLLRLRYNSTFSVIQCKLKVCKKGLSWWDINAEQKCIIIIVNR